MPRCPVPRDLKVRIKSRAGKASSWLFHLSRDEQKNQAVTSPIELEIASEAILPDVGILIK